MCGLPPVDGVVGHRDIAIPVTATYDYTISDTDRGLPRFSTTTIYTNLFNNGDALPCSASFSRQNQNWKFPLEPQFCVCFVKQRIECPCSIHCYSNGNGAKCSPYFFFLILLLHVQMASQQHIVFGCTMYKCFGDGHRSHVLRFICVKYFEQFHSEYCAWYFKRIGRHWSADGKFIQSQRK